MNATVYVYYSVDVVISRKLKIIFFVVYVK